MDNTTNDLLMEGTRGRGKQSASEGSSCHRHGNWNFDGILVLIGCKHKKHIYHKEIVDPQGNMVLVTRKWNKIAKYLHARIFFKTQRNGKMCKDKMEFHQH